MLLLLLNTTTRLLLCFSLLAGICPCESLQAQIIAIKQDAASSYQSQTDAQLKGLSISPQNPLYFDFYIETGDKNHFSDNKQECYLVLIKDFFTALTIPEKDIWVNLSPFEENRIIEEHFGLTATGRDLLRQDFLLKQIASALLYPENESGRRFWGELYRKLWEEYGTTDIPIDILNRVWIIPDQAEVYQEGSSAVVLQGHLKVMLEKDYLSSPNSAGIHSAIADPETNSLDITTDALRKIVIPVLEKEVNEGPDFLRLRQIYQALILSSWYKKTMRESFLGKAYADRSKTGGVRQSDPQENLRIYNQYVETYRQGAFNFIREEIDRNSAETIQRKYFAGGFSAENFSEKVVIRGKNDSDSSQVPSRTKKRKIEKVSTALTPSSARGNSPLDPQVQRLSSILKRLNKQIEAEDLLFSAEILGPDRATLDSVQSQIRQNAFEAISLVLSEEEQKDILLEELAEKIVNGEKTTLQSLLFDGTHTEDVLRHLLALAMLSRERTPVPTERILELMGLRPESVRQTARVIENLKNISGLEELENGLFGLLRTSSSDLKAPGIDHTATLYRLRAEEGIFLSHFDRPSQRPSYFKKIILDAQKLLPRARKTIGLLTHGALSVDLRVKSGSSASKKSNLKPLMEISDFIGGRAVFKDLGAMETQLQRLLNGTSHDKVDILDEWINKAAEEEQILDKKLRRIKKTSPQYQSVQQALSDHNNKRRNLLSSRPLMIEFDNKFMSNRDSYYRAMQFLFAVGTGTWTFELQMKTLPAAISQDMEHSFYKNTKKDSPLINAIRKHNRLVNIIELINYLYSRRDINPDWILFEINKHLPSTEKKHASSDNPPGGIDARHIGKNISVSGSSDIPLILQELTDIENLDGFEAQIISIRPADDLSSVFPAQYPLVK